MTKHVCGTLPYFTYWVPGDISSRTALITGTESDFSGTSPWLGVTAAMSDNVQRQECFGDELALYFSIFSISLGSLMLQLIALRSQGRAWYEGDRVYLRACGVAVSAIWTLIFGAFAGACHSMNMWQFFDFRITAMTFCCAFIVWYVAMYVSVRQFREPLAVALRFGLWFDHRGQWSRTFSQASIGVQWWGAFALLIWLSRRSVLYDSQEAVTFWRPTPLLNPMANVPDGVRHVFYMPVNITTTASDPVFACGGFGGTIASDHPLDFNLLQEPGHVCRCNGGMMGLSCSTPCWPGFYCNSGNLERWHAHGQTEDWLVPGTPRISTWAQHLKADIATDARSRLLAYGFVSNPAHIRPPQWGCSPQPDTSQPSLAYMRLCPKGFWCPEEAMVRPRPVLGGCWGDTLGSVNACPNVCQAGTYCPPGSTAPTPCPPGHYCPIGMDVPTPCPSGTYNPQTGSEETTVCIACPAGKTSRPGSQSCGDVAWYCFDPADINQVPTNASSEVASWLQCDVCPQSGRREKVCCSIGDASDLVAFCAPSERVSDSLCAELPAPEETCDAPAWACSQEGSGAFSKEACSAAACTGSSDVNVLCCSQFEWIVNATGSWEQVCSIDGVRPDAACAALPRPALTCQPQGASYWCSNSHGVAQPCTELQSECSIVSWCMRPWPGDRPGVTVLQVVPLSNCEWQPLPAVCANALQSAELHESADATGQLQIANTATITGGANIASEHDSFNSAPPAATSAGATVPAFVQLEFFCNIHGQQVPQNFTQAQCSQCGYDGTRAVKCCEVAYNKGGIPACTKFRDTADCQNPPFGWDTPASQCLPNAAMFCRLTNTTAYPGLHGMRQSYCRSCPSRSEVEPACCRQTRPDGSMVEDCQIEDQVPNVVCNWQTARPEACVPVCTDTNERDECSDHGDCHTRLFAADAQDALSTLPTPSAECPVYGLEDVYHYFVTAEADRAMLLQNVSMNTALEAWTGFSSTCICDLGYHGHRCQVSSDTLNAGFAAVADQIGKCAGAERALYDTTLVVALLCLTAVIAVPVWVRTYRRGADRPRSLLPMAIRATAFFAMVAAAAVEGLIKCTSDEASAHVLHFTTTFASIVVVLVVAVVGHAITWSMWRRGLTGLEEWQLSKYDPSITLRYFQAVLVAMACMGIAGLGLFAAAFARRTHFDSIFPHITCREGFYRDGNGMCIECPRTPEGVCGGPDRGQCVAVSSDMRSQNDPCICAPGFTGYSCSSPCESHISDAVLPDWLTPVRIYSNADLAEVWLDVLAPAVTVVLCVLAVVGYRWSVARHRRHKQREEIQGLLPETDTQQDYGATGQTGAQDGATALMIRLLGLDGPGGVRLFPDWKPSASHRASDRGFGQCLICFDDAPLIAISPNCEHSMCFDCFKLCLQSGLRDASDCPVACIDPACESIIYPSVADTILSTREAIRYKKFCYENVLGHLEFCPFCNFAFEDLTDVERACPQLQCRQCGEYFCVLCKRAAHAGDCEDQLVAATIAYVREQRQQNRMKPCPRCQADVEKNGGCNHMTCGQRTCGAHFCWRCGFVGPNGGAIYRHLGECRGEIPWW